MNADRVGSTQDDRNRDTSSFLLAFYKFLIRLIAPFAPLWLRWRALCGKEEPARMQEKLGIYARARDEGPLIWIHAASVGESLSVLSLITSLCAGGHKVLLSTVTRSSARLMRDRLPTGATHVFAPLDTHDAVTLFLEHWRPSLAVWTESELWPNLICETARRGTIMLLINGRMSLRSFRRWRLAPQSASELLGRFVLCLAQDNDSAERLTALGARNTRAPGNLKHDAHPLPANAGSLSEMRHMLQGRPYWLCASTHPGEEDVLLATHEILAQGDPRLLTILAPRHPERGSDIALRARARGLGCVRRSFAEKIGDETSLYIADTLGELGLFYRLCDIVFMGGSLIAHGGQNPLEAARLSCALLTGPHTQNFHDIYAALEKQGGLIRVSDAAALSAAVEGLLEDPQARQRSAQTALDYAKSVSGVLARVISAMEPYLPPLMDRSDARP